MGAWGLGLFQSDHDLDIVAGFSDEASCELYYPENIEASRKCLDDGALERMVRKRWSDGHNANKCRGYGDRPDYELVLLGACAMTMGAKLPPDLKEYMQEKYRGVGLMRDAIKQMEKGLREYTEGTPYDFGSKGLNETMMSGGPAREDLLYPGGMLMNVQSPGQDPALTAAFQRAGAQMRAAQQQHGGPPATAHPADACGNCGRRPGEGEGALRKCTGCRVKLYCNRGCQRADWNRHKAACTGAASSAA